VGKPAVDKVGKPAVGFKEYCMCCHTHLECCVQAAGQQKVAAGVPSRTGDAGGAATIVLQQRIAAQVPQLYTQAGRAAQAQRGMYKE
jgi:hypothetical protein